MSDRPTFGQTLVDNLKGAVAGEIEDTVTSMMPSGVSFARRNPDGDDDENDDDGEYDDDGEGIGALSFEDEDAGDNLAAAVAAFRMLGHDDDVVAQHKGTGYTFFGTAEELTQYQSATDRPDGWDQYTGSAKIMEMEYDEGTMREVLDMMSDPATVEALAEAEANNEGFMWGNATTHTGVKHVPGINAPMHPLGIARELPYYSDKGGEPVEYIHSFGSNGDGKGGECPGVYAIGDSTLVIHGAKMRIEDRGVVK